MFKNKGKTNQFICFIEIYWKSNFKPPPSHTNEIPKFYFANSYQLPILTRPIPSPFFCLRPSLFSFCILPILFPISISGKRLIPSIHRIDLSKSTPAKWTIALLLVLLFMVGTRTISLLASLSFLISYPHRVSTIADIILSIF